MTDKEGTKADTLKVCSSSGVNPTSTLMKWWLLLPAGPNLLCFKAYAVLFVDHIKCISCLYLGFLNSVNFSLNDHFFAKSSDHAIV